MPKNDLDNLFCFYNRWSRLPPRRKGIEHLLRDRFFYQIFINKPNIVVAAVDAFVASVAVAVFGIEHYFKLFVGILKQADKLPCVLNVDIFVSQAVGQQKLAG